MVKPFTKLIYLFLLLKMPRNQHYARNYNRNWNHHQDISPSAQSTQSMDFSIYDENKENKQNLKARNNNNNNSEIVKNLRVHEMRKWIKQDQELDEKEEVERDELRAAQEEKRKELRANQVSRRKLIQKEKVRMIGGLN